MEIEAGTITFMIAGFTVVNLGFIVILIFLFIKQRKRHLFWFVLQIISLVMTFYFALKVIQQNDNVPNVMLSETNSLHIGYSVVFWSIGMMFMIIGIWCCCKKSSIDEL